MKLRNKKTGEIVNAMFYAPIGGYEITIWKDTDYLDPTSDRHKLGVYSSLSKLNEEWEDYDPAKPLIKDEKIRKAVRAWAEANDICRVIHYKTAVGVELLEINYEHPAEQKTAIEFNNYSGLKEGKEYTIAELCGEDE